MLENLKTLAKIILKKKYFYYNFRIKKVILFCLVFFICNMLLYSFIKDFGTDEIVDYTKYGYFENLGTNDYRYVIRDKKVLGSAQGEGVYPNRWTFFSNERYIELEKNGLLEGSRWSFVSINDPELSYYKWSISFQEDPGIRQFYIARAMEDAGYIKHAIKAYYSIIVFFPKTSVKLYSKVPFYISVIAKDRILYLLKKHPEINWSLKNVNIVIDNKFDKDLTNDIFHINPGKIIVTKKKEDYLKNNPDVNFLKGVVYSAVPVGQSAFDTKLSVESAYGVWVDENLSEQQERTEKAVGDLKLMENMGVNTCIFRTLDSKDLNKNLLKDLKNKFNIKVVLCFDLEYNALDKFYKELPEFIELHKNEDYLFLWMLRVKDMGNLKYGLVQGIYKKINTIARAIKKVDMDHLVAFSNEDLFGLDVLSNEFKDIDILGLEVFRGNIGFGNSFWQDVRKFWKKPFFISAYGASAYTLNHAKQYPEDFQLLCHENYWEDIFENINEQCLGGCIYEWVDQWWRKGNDSFHDQIGVWQGPFIDFFLYDEWMGIFSQGKGKNTPYQRTKRKVYDYYKNIWKKEKI